MRSRNETATLEEVTMLYANNEELKESCKKAHKNLKTRAKWISVQSSNFHETQRRFQIDEQNAQVEPIVKYQLVVCIKDTNQENGPGHVSCFVQKITIDGNKINHTSFYPGAVGCIVNGISLGSIPVLGILAQSHEEDLEESDHVMVAPLTEDLTLRI